MKRKALLSILALAASASAAVAKQAPLPPPYQGVYQPKGIDEIGLWHEEDEDERQLAASPVLIRDENLTAYVKRVLCETVGSDRCASVRVYIIREPTFNATMSANGTLRVLSGLFLRVHNEAELGAILGHEFGHFEQRHGLNKFKAGRTGSDILAWGALLASMSPSYENRRSFSNLKLSVYGNLYRYERNQEREADLLGLGYLNASKLRPQDASLVWQRMIKEAEASATVRGLKKPDFNAIAFTASHPPHAERAAYLAEFADPDGAARDEGADRYRQALAPWLPVFLDDQIKLNDFGASDFIINSLAEDGWTAQLWYARGELYRTRGNLRDTAHAVGFYSKAIEADPRLIDAYRGLGLSLFKTGQREAGQAALRHYLDLKPDASDAAMLGMMLPKEEPAQ